MKLSKVLMGLGSVGGGVGGGVGAAVGRILGGPGVGGGGVGGSVGGGVGGLGVGKQMLGKSTQIAVTTNGGPGPKHISVVGQPF